MFQSLGRGDVFEVGKWGVAEGTARSGKPYLAYLAACATTETLVHSVVLGIDGEQGNVVLFGRGYDEFARSNEALFVREAYGLAGFYSGVSGFKSGDSNDG
jgi:hypothetical protein